MVPRNIQGRFMLPICYICKFLLPIYTAACIAGADREGQTNMASLAGLCETGELQVGGRIIRPVLVVVVVVV